LPHDPVPAIMEVVVAAVDKDVMSDIAARTSPRAAMCSS